MNIICCSLPAIWGNELLLGVDGPCPAVISRANTIAPEVCAVVLSTVRTDGAFFVDASVSAAACRLCFRFSFEGGQ